MIRVAVTTGLMALAVSICGAQSSTSSGTTANQPPAAAAAPGSAPVIPVELAKSLDSKKLKQGDEVDAKTSAEMRTGDGTVIPRGSRVVGHVTQSTARSGGSPDSTLAFAFDKIVLKDGKELPLKATLQAVAPPAAASGPNTGSNMGTAGASSTGPSTNDARTQSDQMGGSLTPSTLPGRSANPGQPDTSAPANAGTQPGLTGQSTGIVGIHGLEMGQDSVIKSNGKSVKLDGGTRLVLRVQTQ